MATSLDAVFKVNLGLVLVAAGDNAGGKVNLSQQSEKSAIAQLALGNIAHQGGEFDEAIGHYSEALRLEPTFVDAASNLCGSQIELFKTTLDNQHTLQETTFRLEKMISSFKRCQSAHSKLGLCHRLCGKHGLAQRYLWGAVTLDHSNADELCNLAALHVETGKYEQAAKLCLRALQPSPDHAQAFGTLGLALFQMGYNKNALECLIQPNNSIPRVQFYPPTLDQCYAKLEMLFNPQGYKRGPLHWIHLTLPHLLALGMVRLHPCSCSCSFSIF